MADNFVRNGVTAEINANEGAVSTIGTLADSIRDFLGLAVTHANAALAVASHDERSEVETTAAFDDLRATVDVDDLVVVFRRRSVVTIVATWTTARSARTTASATRATRAAGTTTIATRTGTARGGGSGRGRRGFDFFAHEIRSSGRPDGRLRRTT